MKKLAIVLVFALSLVGAAQASAPKTVTVAMHDPGCHWFLVNGKYVKTLTIAGPVRLANYDEAALKVADPHGVKLEPVGSKLSLAKGVYRITMVGQAPDDNHLVLTVR